MVHVEELLGPRGRGGEVGADERAARVVLEPPPVRIEGRGPQLVGESGLLVGAEDERERIDGPSPRPASTNHSDPSGRRAVIPR